MDAVDHSPRGAGGSGAQTLAPAETSISRTIPETNTKVSASPPEKRLKQNQTNIFEKNYVPVHFVDVSREKYYS